MANREMVAVHRGTGTTSSERYLAKAAERTFLRLWSYPNLFIDKKQHAKGAGKEFCDLLVVFGDDIIIFSDKEVAWTDAEDVSVSWSRWARKSIAKSVDQIVGAERWLAAFPDRIFLDSACAKKLPINLPSPENRKVHGIVVASGSRKPCQSYFDGGSGTLVIAPEIRGRDHFNPTAPNFKPFTIGDVNPEGSFVHVFDESALDFVMSELDTVGDFVRYLNKREAFFRSGKLLQTPGEEDLLGYYLQREDKNSEHDFVDPRGAEIPDGSQVIIEQGQYQNLIARPEYRRKQEADRISFAWDALIETFAHHIISGTSVPVFGARPDVAEAEQGLRIMASERRVNRRILAEALIDAIERAGSRGEDRFARIVLPGNHSADSETAYVFLVLKYPNHLNLQGGYEQYRKVRTNFLHAYCLATLEKNRHLERAVGIGLDARTDIGGGSEDLLVLQIKKWTPALAAQAHELRTKFEIMDPKKQERGGISTSEYPDGPVSISEPLSRQQRRALERALKKKRKRQR